MKPLPTPAPNTPNTPSQPSQPSRPLRRALRVLALVGLLLTWAFNLAYLHAGGSLLPQVFFRDATANALTTAITLDVYLAALAFSVWVLAEQRVRHPGRYVAGCFAVGLAVALPLYLANRRDGR